MNKYYSEDALELGAVKVGQELTHLEKEPTLVDVVRFCAAIRNFHRFHFDQEFIQQHGIDGNIVPGFLTGNWCIEAVSRSFGAGHEISSLKFRNIATAPVGNHYRITGTVKELNAENNGAITCEVTVTDVSADKPVTTATVGLRQR